MPAQRRFPTGRKDLAEGWFLQVDPANLRSTTFYLGLTENHEAFWNRFDDNLASVEFRLAQMARVGVNGVRLWSSYRADLRAQYIESNRQNLYWQRVAEFLTRANDYDIAGTIVLFNTANYSGGPGDVSGENLALYTPPHLSMLDETHVELELERTFAVLNRPPLRNAACVITCSRP